MKTKNVTTRNGGSPKPAQHWTREPLAFMNDEARKIYRAVGADGWKLSDFQDIFAIRNWYEAKHPEAARSHRQTSGLLGGLSTDPQIGLLDQPIGEINPEEIPLLTKEELAELCGIDESAPADSACLMCSKMGQEARFPLVLRYSSIVDSSGKIVFRQGNFFRYGPSRGNESRIACICGLLQIRNKDKQGNTKNSYHLMEALNYRVTMIRPCYDWTTLQVMIQKEEAKKVADIAQAVAEAAATTEEQNRQQKELRERAQKSLAIERENRRLATTALDEFFGI